MTKRCRHELETKSGYPNDRICQKCGTIWRLTDYKDWAPTQLMALPKQIRYELLQFRKRYEVV